MLQVQYVDETWKEYNEQFESDQEEHQQLSIKHSFDDLLKKRMDLTNVLQHVEIWTIKFVQIEFIIKNRKEI